MLDSRSGSDSNRHSKLVGYNHGQRGFSQARRPRQQDVVRGNVTFTGSIQKQLQLQKVSGIGPKVALSLLSTLPPERLAKAVADGDATALAKAPGLGKKGAQKIILELKGSIDLSQIEGASKEVRSAEDAGSEQVVEGLMSLGWRQQDALHAVQTVCESNHINVPLRDDDVPRVLKLALASLDRGR